MSVVIAGSSIIYTYPLASFSIVSLKAVTNPKNTFSATKRYIGRRFEDDEVKKDM